MSYDVCSSLKLELSEFCSAMQKYPSTPSKELKTSELKLYVASPAHVFDSSTLVGRIRVLLDQLWKWLSKRSNQGKLEEAVEAIIHQSFDQVIQTGYQARQEHLVHRMKMIESHFKLVSDEAVKAEQMNRYVEQIQSELADSQANLTSLSAHFNSKLKEKSFNAADAESLRRVVTNICQAVMPFWDNMLLYKHTFSHPLASYIPSQPIQQTDKAIDWAITDPVLYKVFRKEQEWINLEGLLGQPIPVIELIKICELKPRLAESEIIRLRKWVKSLNQLPEELKKNPIQTSAVNLLQNSLEEIVKAAYVQGHFEEISVGLLINKLNDYGCTLMEQEDANHLAWRNELEEGKTILCSGAEPFTLGKELKGSTHQAVKLSTNKIKNLRKPRDQFKVFELLDYPDWVVKIGSSPFDLAIENYNFRQHHCAIPGIEAKSQIDETDDGRPILFLKKAPVTFSNYQWKSETYRLCDLDQTIGERVGSFLFCMYDWKKWLRGVSFKNLALDSENILTSLKSCEGASDDFLAAEDFCIKAAMHKGNELHKHALRYLIEVSNYSRHRMAGFYRDTVFKMLKTGEFDFFNVSLPDGFNQSKYLAKIQPLFKRAQALRETCAAQVALLQKEQEQGLMDSWALLRKEQAQIAARIDVTHEGREKNNLIREQRELIRKMEGLEDSLEALKENTYEMHLVYLNEWKHFDLEKEGLKEEWIKLETELEGLDKEISKSKANLPRLEDRKKRLNISKIELQKEILTLTVYDRLLEAYLDLPTASWLPDSLYDQVLASFKEGKPIERTVYDPKYYEQQQKMIIAKNLISIERKKSGENNN